MRFTYAESMCDPSHLPPLAVAAERCGWHSFTVPDSIAYPEFSDSRYPYTPDGSREFLEDRPFLEPFSLIPALGAVTERLRFSTFVVKLPVRSPVLVAKQAASVAVLTGNRLDLGVGLSPWPEDYRLCGQPWEGRGARMDEMLAILRGLTTPRAGAGGTAYSGAPGAYFAYAGRHYQIESVKLCPVPSEPIPLLIGGHSEPALRRAARLADGWMHAGGPGEDLAAMLARLAALRREAGRAAAPFQIHVISLDAYGVDGVRRLEDLGVTDVIVGFRNVYEKDTQTLQQKIDALEGFAENVISRV